MGLFVIALSLLGFAVAAFLAVVWKRNSVIQRVPWKRMILASLAVATIGVLVIASAYLAN